MNNNTEWKIASAFIIGKGHIIKNIPCQDRTFRLVEKHKSGVFYGLSLADGAGSCKHSDIGAELVTNKTLHYLKSNFSSLFSKKNPEKTIIQYIETRLKDKSKADNLSFKELSSTLLFVAIKNDKFIIGHIGDGVIGMLNNKDEILTISQPENGEFSNSTYFTTSIEYQNRLRIIKGKIKNGIGFILMSDGSEESLYDKKNRSLINVNKEIINWLENNSEKDVEEALYKNLKEVISQKTIDDCSIGIIRKDVISFD